MFRLENLEGRRHLAASISNGVLYVTGTDGNDDINIYEDSEVRVWVNGRQSSFDDSAFTRVEVSGKPGDDYIAISPSLGFPATVYAGLGRDRILGGSKSDLLVGGSGYDSIRGGGAASPASASSHTARQEAFIGWSACGSAGVIASSL